MKLPHRGTDNSECPMRYCKNCSLPALKHWRGWPLRLPVPVLQEMANEKCPKCGNNGVIDSNDILWENYHSQGSTGLPDYWLLNATSATALSKWSKPYYARLRCSCGNTATVSQFGNEKQYRFALSYQSRGVREDFTSLA